MLQRLVVVFVSAVGVQDRGGPTVVPPQCPIGARPMATLSDDPHLGRGPSDDHECLLDKESDESDSGSVLSDDSVLPDYEREEEDRDQVPANTLYEACALNQVRTLTLFLEAGVTNEQAMELDVNGRVRRLDADVVEAFCVVFIQLHPIQFPNDLMDIKLLTNGRVGSSLSLNRM